ncbi:MAG: DUF3052 family protein [Chloroflexi bacterium]|nr:MAG: DUF3052 family protein [Chloroflexota bacterium]
MPERPLLDKLGVKPRMRVSLLDVGEDWFRELLAERTGDLHDAPVQGSDLVFMKAETPADLEHLGSLRRLIKEDGAIWVLRRKGAGRTLSETDLIAAGPAAGLVDNKIASFSPELGAMRFVIRLRDRRGSGSSTNASEE